MNSKVNIMVSYTNPQEIGQDGLNSRTYLADDKNLNRKIVVKELNQYPNWSLDQYYQEARILNEVKHPNVVEIILAGEKISEDINGNIIKVNQVMLAMPYYKNGSLKQMLEQKKLTENEKHGIALNILHGLESIHRKRLMHLDLKPDNILISDRKEALISDFGISKYLKQIRDFIKWEEGMSMSPFLAPPEIFATKPHISRKTDIYHLGILFYLLYTQISIEDFTGFTVKDLQSGDNFKLNKYLEKVKSGKIFVDSDQIPKEIKVIIKKCLEVDPNKRYSNVSEINRYFNIKLS